MAADLVRVLLQATLASSAALILTLALRGTLRRRFGARVAYALWASVPLALLATLLPAPAIVPMAAPATASALDAPPHVLATIVAWPTAAERVGDVAWIGVAWLLGVLAAALAFASRQRRFERALGRLSPVRGGEMLRAQSSAGCPALLGAWQPRVVLPADFEQRYSAAECELILAHERLHRARGDAQANALAAALRCLFWFNPLLHAAHARFRFDQELACDADVIARFPQARKPYASAMLKAQLAADGVPFGCQWQATHPLTLRVAQLARPLPGRARALTGASLALVLIACGTCAAWALQPAALPSTAARALAELAIVAARTDAPPAPSNPVPDLLLIVSPVSPGTGARDGASDAGTPRTTRTPSAPDANASASAAHPATATERRVSRSAESDATTRAAATAPAAVAASAPANRINFVAPAFVPPRVTQHWKPPYPNDAFVIGDEGEAQVLVTIAADGTLRDARVVASSRSPALDDASLDAARHYSYAPARKDGVPVEAQAIVAVDWSITPSLRQTIASGLARTVDVGGLPHN